MKRENNRGKSQIIMREEKPQERVVQLRQYQKEPNHSVVVDLDWISMYSLPLHIHLFLVVVGHLPIVSNHSRIESSNQYNHAMKVNHTSRASILFL